MTVNKKEFYEQDFPEYVSHVREKLRAGNSLTGQKVVDECVLYIQALERLVKANKENNGELLIELSNVCSLLGEICQYTALLSAYTMIALENAGASVTYKAPDEVVKPTITTFDGSGIFGSKPLQVITQKHKAPKVN